MTPRYVIICAERDTNGTIISVGLRDQPKRSPKWMVVDNLKNKTAQYFTEYKGKLTEVHYFCIGYGNCYIRTDRNRTPKDNLENVQNC